MHFECTFPTKALLTNGTLMLFNLFMDAFYVFFQVCILESRITAQITFERPDVFMHRLYMPIKIDFLAKALLTYTTLVLFEFFMDTFNVSSHVCMIESRIITQITFRGSGLDWDGYKENFRGESKNVIKFSADL